MVKFKGKKQKSESVAEGTGKAKKAEKRTKGQTKAAEYVGNLLQLHKLQGVLLTRLDKEVR